MAKGFEFDWHTHKWALLYCAVSSIGALCYGYDNTYYNGVLAMQEFKNDFGNHVDADTGRLALATSFQALTASSIYIGDLVGAIVSAPINDRWGRKAVFWFASFCILAGGIVQVVDTHYESLIIVGRILMGLGMGQFTVTSLLYMGEVAPTAIRGPMLMMFQFLQSWSQLAASGLTQGTESIKSSLSYKLPMGGLVVLPLIMFAALPFVPESPAWFMLKGRREEAEASLRHIYRSQQPAYDPTADMLALEEMRATELRQAETSTWRDLIVNPIERRKMVYSAGAMFSQQICGILFFYVYGVVFVQALGMNNPFLIQLITNIVQIFAVGISTALANRVPRRTNLFTTTGAMLVAYLVIGGLGTQNPLSTAAKYVIVVFSFIVVVGFNFGLGPLAYTVARETAVGTNQNKIMSVSIVIFYFTTWLVSFTAPYIYYDAGLGPMLAFIYAGTSLLALAWTYFCVGETVGRSNLEISLFFSENIPARHWKTHVFDPIMLEGKGDGDAEKAAASTEHHE